MQNPNPYAVQRAGITAGVSNGGTCAVESALGKGSRFWFRIPHQPPAAAVG